MGFSAICHAVPWAKEYLPPDAQAGYQETMWGRVYWLDHLDLRSASILEMADVLARKQVSVDPTLMPFGQNSGGMMCVMQKTPIARWLLQSFGPVGRKEATTKNWTPEQYRTAKAQRPKLLDLRRFRTSSRN